MATRQNAVLEISEIVGSLSKFAGTLVGIIASAGKKVAGFVGGLTFQSTRVAKLESELAAVRRQLKQARSVKPTKKKSPASTRPKAKSKTATSKSSGRSQKTRASKALAKAKASTASQKTQTSVVNIKASGGKPAGRAVASASSRM